MSHLVKNGSGLALVTGARGFIGRHCALHLAKRGWQVVGIGRGEWPPADHREWGVERWIEADVDELSVAKSGDGLDLVIHCAGGAHVGASIDDPMRDFRATVDSTVALLDYLRRAESNARVVYPSSAAVYGSAPPPIHEDTPARPLSPYGAHKGMAEQACRTYASMFGLNVSVVRLFSVYGPGLRKQLFWEACMKMQTGSASFGGSGDEMRDWLHVADAVSLICLAADHASPDAPVVNGGTGQGTPVREAVDLLAREFDGVAAEFTGSVRTGDPQHIVADIGRALDWGWSPTYTLADGIREYVSWFKKTGKCGA